MTPGRPVTPAAPQRVIGLDLARGVILIGIFVIHFYRLGGGAADAGPAFRDWAPVAGFSAFRVGFVLVSGIALGVSTAGRAPRQVRRGLLIRAAILLPLGLALQELFPDGGISVILQNFAVIFVLALPFIGRRDRALLGWSILFGLAGTVALSALAVAQPETAIGEATRLVAPPLDTVRSLVLTGDYPALMHMGPFLLGMWLGREGRLGAAGRLPWVATAVGVAVLVAGAAALLDALMPATTPGLPQVLADPTAEAISPTWLVNAVAWQGAVIVICLALATALPRLTLPVAAMGQMSLTVYVGHLLVIAVNPGVMRTTSVPGAVGRAVLTAVIAAAFASWWVRRHRRGPLEAAMHAAITWREPRPAPGPA